MTCWKYSAVDARVVFVMLKVVFVVQRTAMPACCCTLQPTVVQLLWQAIHGLHSGSVDWSGVGCGEFVKSTAHVAEHEGWLKYCGTVVFRLLAGQATASGDTMLTPIYCVTYPSGQAQVAT